jgi:hypothetical protein
LTIEHSAVRTGANHLSQGVGIMPALEHEWSSIKKRMRLADRIGDLEQRLENDGIGDLSLMGYVLHKVQEKLETAGVALCEATMPSIGINFIGTFTSKLLLFNFVV